MPRAAKWALTLAAVAGVFALAWWLCDFPLGMDTGNALGVAAIPSSLVGMPLAWWAGRESAPPPPNIVVHLPPVLAPAEGQVVVGPVPREPQHFQRRDQIEELARLAEAGAVAVVCAVTGQRGVGKTQLVGAYARQRIADGWLVAWFPAETSDAVTTGLGELADALGLRREGDEATATLGRLRSHLQTLQDPALLVFDNVTDPDDVTPHLPAAGSAQIVLTSASHTVDQLGTRVPVDLFTPDTAVRFLLDTTGLRDDKGARRLAEKLGYLPLALAQAAARIARVERNFATYLDRLDQVSLDQALRARPGDPYPLGAAEAILLAVEPFLDTPAGSLLDVLSVLSPGGVSRELLVSVASDIAVDDQLEVLFEASLIEYAGSPDSPVLVMHRLTQRALRDRADHDLDRILVSANVVLLRATFPPEEAWQRRELGEEIIRHTDSIREHAGRGTPSPAVLDGVVGLRRWGTKQLIESAVLDRAVDLAIAARDDHLSVHVDDQVDVLSLDRNLADAYQAVGRLDEAIPLRERGLTAWQAELGADHPWTMAAVNNLAFAYQAAGQLEKAIPLHEQSLADCERLLGVDDHKTLSAVSNLAGSYLAAGRLDEATALTQRMYDTRRRVLGDEHVETIGGANSLAVAYLKADRVDEAVPLLEQALADSRTVSGEDHPYTLTTASNLASAYEMAGKLAEAVALHERTLAERRRLLGADHPDTLGSAHNLAALHCAAGRFDDAIALHQKTFAGYRRVLGRDHPTTLTSACNLAVTYYQAGRLDDAIALHERNLADQVRVLGEGHPDTFVSCNALAVTLMEAERFTEALPLFVKAGELAERIYGPEHELAKAVRILLAKLR